MPRGEKTTEKQTDLDFDGAVDQEKQSLLGWLREHRRALSALSLMTVLAGVVDQWAGKDKDEIDPLPMDQIELVVQEETPDSKNELMEKAQTDPASILINIANIDDHEVLITAAEANPSLVMMSLEDEKIASHYGMLEAALIADPIILEFPGDYEYLPEILETLSSEQLEKAQALLDIETDYKTKKRLAALLDPFLKGELTQAQALEVAQDDTQFFRQLIEINALADHAAAVTVERQLGDIAFEQIHEINELHDKADQIRFKSVQGAQASEIYTLLAYTSDSEAPYTSTINGLVDRMLQNMDQEGINGQELLTQVGQAEVQLFMKTLARKDRLGDFLGTMENAQQLEVLATFLGGLDQQPDMISQGGIIADVIKATEDPTQRELMAQVLQTEYQRVAQENDQRGIAAYGILSRLVTENPDWLDSETAADYEIVQPTEIAVNELMNDEGQIIQRYYFYDDKDGYASYYNFLSQYKGKSGWKIKVHDGYTTVSSTQTEKPIVMYANHPDHDVDMVIPDEPQEEDVVAQAMAADGVTPSVVVHRGHSYHNIKTIQHMPDSAKVVVLGSCGGYDSVPNVLAAAPDAQIISTQGTGTAVVNDSLLALLNQQIAETDMITWDTYWEQAEKQLGDNRDFARYMAPDQNYYAQFVDKFKRLATSTV